MAEKIRLIVLRGVRESGRTQKDIAEAASMSRAQLNGYLLGKREIRTDTLQRLLDTLGIKLRAITDKQ